MLSLALESYSIPVLSLNGAIAYTMSSDYVVQAVDTENGKVLWDSPKDQRFVAIEAYQDGLLVLQVDAQGYSNGACRLKNDGAILWCSKLERRFNSVVVGESGSGIGVMDEYKNLQILDPQTGKPLGELLYGGELHIYYDLGQPHDTMFVPGAVLLGEFNGTTVVATDQSLIGLSANSSWSKEVAEAGMGIGGFGSSLAFAHRVAPELGGSAGGLFLIGELLVGLDEKGKLLYTRPAQARRLVQVKNNIVLITEKSVSRLDPATGSPSWTQSLAGIAAISGEQGWIGYQGPEQPILPVILFDPVTGAIQGQIQPEAGELYLAPCGVLLKSKTELSCKNTSGMVWSYSQNIGQLEFLKNYAFGYLSANTTVMLDLLSGVVKEQLSGYLMDAKGSTLLMSFNSGYQAYRLH